jgi:hypothetical protein
MGIRKTDKVINRNFLNIVEDSWTRNLYLNRTYPKKLCRRPRINVLWN